MTEEERKQKEAELEGARASADAAQTAASEADFKDETLNKASDDAEEKVKALEAELAAPPDSDDEEDEDDEGDIDFENEAKNLPPASPPAPPAAPDDKATKLDKAKKRAHFLAKEIRDLGGDPTEVFGDPPAPPTSARPSHSDGDEGKYVTIEGLARRDAETIAYRISKSEAEKKVIMHKYDTAINRTGNVEVDIKNAYLIAHQGRIARSWDEIRRAQGARVTPGGGGPGARRPMAPRTPSLAPEMESRLRSRGFKKLPDGSWEGKKHKLVWNPKTRQLDQIRK